MYKQTADNLNCLYDELLVFYKKLEFHYVSENELFILHNNTWKICDSVQMNE